jgi:hypothetical protein
MLWHAEELSHTKIRRRHFSLFEAEPVHKVLSPLYVIGQLNGFGQFCGAYLDPRPQTPSLNRCRAPNL